MQAPLSTIASGKIFHTGPLSALVPSAANTVFSTLSHLPELPFAGSDLPALRTSTPVAEGVGLVHDAGNLLGALGLYCDLLALPGVLRDEHRHYAEELRLLSGRSRKLIDRLLNPETTGRRVESHDASAHLDTELVVIPDVIEGCRGLLNAVAQRAVAVAYGAGAALPVAVTREALERILVNLTKNAAEASDGEEDRAITLRVTSQRGKGVAGRVLLTVEDKGRGMSTAAVKVLMSKTPAKLDPASRRGIGFQVVRELVGASGGQLRLSSQTDGASSGTTVEIAWMVTATEAERVSEATPVRPLSSAVRRLRQPMAARQIDGATASRRMSC